MKKFIKEQAMDDDQETIYPYIRNPDKAFHISLLSPFFYAFAVPRKVFGRVFTPLEAALLDALKKGLSKENAEILHQQLSEINCVQRDHYKKDTLCTLYKFGLFVIWLKRKKMFSFEHSCARLCKITFLVDNVKIFADFEIYDNALSFINYSNNIQPYLGQSDIKIIDVDMNIVPMDTEEC